MQNHSIKISTTNSSIHTESKGWSINIGRLFTALSPWPLFALVVVACMLLTGLGTWVGYLRFLTGVELSESTIDTAVGAILGLLAFILGFTFSLTWSRFAARNSLVMLQAKALGVCYLRTSLLPPNQKLVLRKLFKEYVGVLLEMQTIGNVEKSVTRIDDLHIVIWNQTASLVNEDMDSELRTFFSGAVNELISLWVERKTVALVYSIPTPIWNSLMLLVGISMFAFGYQTGITGITRIFQIALLPLPFGLVIVLIADLNSTLVQRRFKVTKKPLQDVQEMMEKEIE